MRRRTQCRARHRGFSLIELLLSVFILAIGIISVSALFPAGIAQQQQTTDDQLGPVVAEQALGTLRSRLRPQDFGTFEEFLITDVLSQTQSAGDSFGYRPAPGDWGWIRPGVIRGNQAGINLPAAEQVGAIDIFSAIAQRDGGSGNEFCEFPSGLVGGSNISLFGAPYSTVRSFQAPLVVVSQRERWWPELASGAAVGAPAQYAWECMFRRHGGRVQVGIFVFRIVGVGGAARNWSAAVAGQPSLANAIAAGYGDLPPVPYRRVTASTSANAGSATAAPGLGAQVTGAWVQPTGSLNMATPGLFTTGLLNTGIATGDLPNAAPPPVQSQWQFPGQWWIDNNGNVHRVAQGRRSQADPLQVRLTAPVPRVNPAQVFADYELPAQTPLGVRTIHYVPVVIDANGTQLVPVYATVRDL